MDEGELVEVLEARRIGTGPAAQTWYKVLPPRASSAGCPGQFVPANSRFRKCARRDPNNNLLIARHASGRERYGDRQEVTPRFV